MELIDYKVLLKQGFLKNLGSLAITLLVVVGAQWFYYLSLHGMGENVTRAELADVLLSRFGADMAIMLMGFFLLYQVTRRLISPMRLGVFRFSIDTSVAGFVAIFFSLVVALILSIIVSLTLGEIGPYQDNPDDVTWSVTVVVIGTLIIAFFMYCWIALLAQCVVNRYLPKSHRKGLWRLVYLRNKTTARPMLISALLITLPPIAGKYFEYYQNGGAGIATLFQVLSVVAFAMGTAAGVAYVVKMEAVRLKNNVE